jgi:hypothetical protein
VANFIVLYVLVLQAIDCSKGRWDDRFSFFVSFEGWSFRHYAFLLIGCLYQCGVLVASIDLVCYFCTFGSFVIIDLVVNTLSISIYPSKVFDEKGRPW